MSTASDNELEAYLAPFGLSSFRPGQREVIRAVLNGEDCLCVMPTGGGKSLCYQLPAVAGPGLTLVVSPLIALMKDQVDSLTARGIPATFINSTLNPEEQAARLAGMVRGEYQLVYVVPERFRSSRFLAAARQSSLRLLAVDEAHCVSEWGHDFRPDYSRLGDFRRQLGNPPTIALTATATDSVRRDIVELLSLRDPRVFITGFARPNLHYAVQICPTDRDKDEYLFRFLDKTPGSGIIYASTRKRCEELAERIAGRTNRRTTIYHAGLTSDARRAAQEDFMQGRTQIAVATLAFGMGIDKSDVRFVVHYNLPGSLEAYYQEAGRAGRDGQPASCLLLFGGGDRYIHEFFIESAYPGRDVVRQVYDFLRRQESSTVEITQQELKTALGLSIGTEGVGACEKLLEAAGAIERLEPSENQAALRLNSQLPTLVDLLPPQAKKKRKILRAVERLVGSQRYEWCYFPPRAILAELPELSSAELTRNLRELSALTAFDYVPPFRGRAIHICQRDRHFDELAIDFETLDRHKAAEYARVDQVVQFARSPRCRQQIIVHYFGELDAAACGHCDNCGTGTVNGRWGAVRQATPAVHNAIRMVLSGVARARGRCGRQLLAQMLCGSKAKGVIRNRLDKLTTFGLLGFLNQQEVAQLIDAMLVAGLVEQNEIEQFRPIVQLTPLGEQVMRESDAAVAIALPDELWHKLSRQTNSPAAPASSGESQADLRVESALHDRLRRWRDATSKALQAPAYTVFANAVLEELARVRPRTAEGLLTIKGIGPAKARQYGEEILRMVAEAEATASGVEVQDAPDDSVDDAFDPFAEDINSVSESHAAMHQEPMELSEENVELPTEDVVESAAPLRPSHYWTWRLLSAGLTPEECAAARAIAVEMVLDHALRAAGEGLPVDATWFLTPQAVTTIEAAVGEQTSVSIRQLLPKLPRGTRYEEVQLVLKARETHRVPE